MGDGGRSRHLALESLVYSRVLEAPEGRELRLKKKSSRCIRIYLSSQKVSSRPSAASGETPVSHLVRCLEPGPCGPGWDRTRFQRWVGCFRCMPYGQARVGRAFSRKARVTPMEKPELYPYEKSSQASGCSSEPSRPAGLSTAQTIRLRASVEMTLHWHTYTLIF